MSCEGFIDVGSSSLHCAKKKAAPSLPSLLLPAGRPRNVKEENEADKRDREGNRKGKGEITMILSNSIPFSLLLLPFLFHVASAGEYDHKVCSLSLSLVLLFASLLFWFAVSSLLLF
jgi:hypothetical protein